MNRVVTTQKGTVLPILELRGKAYLQVAWRLVWFREDHPDWSIETDLVRHAEDAALFRGTIKNESGRIMATAHKFEDRKGFADFLEKAETGAIGRALAMCGYGTQFTDDLDEGRRLADAPLECVKMSLVKQEEVNPIESQKDAENLRKRILDLIESIDPQNPLREQIKKTMEKTDSTKKLAQILERAEAAMKESAK